MTEERRIARKRLNAIAGIASIFFVAVYVIILGIETNLKPESSAPAAGDQLADRIGRQISVKAFDKQGKLNHRLQTDHAEYFLLHKSAAGDFNYHTFEHDDSLADWERQSGQVLIKMQKPVFNFYQDGTSIAQITANEALLDGNSNQAELYGEVRIDDVVNDIQLLTEFLNVDANQKQVFTKETVSIDSPTSNTTASGLQGNLADQRWQLLADVKSLVQP